MLHQERDEKGKNAGESVSSSFVCSFFSALISFHLYFLVPVPSVSGPLLLLCVNASVLPFLLLTRALVVSVLWPLWSFVLCSSFFIVARLCDFRFITARTLFQPCFSSWLLMLLLLHCGCSCGCGCSCDCNCGCG